MNKGKRAASPCDCPREHCGAAFPFFAAYVCETLSRRAHLVFFWKRKVCYKWPGANCKSLLGYRSADSYVGISFAM